MTGFLYGGQSTYLSGTAQANATDHNVSGFAWSGYDTNGDSNLDSGIGWIGFNCKDSSVGGTFDQCPPIGTSDYGVNIETTVGPDQGLFSGYAWSSNGDASNGFSGPGWITFNRTEMGNNCPPPSGTGTCEARLYPNNTITGWARACSVAVSGCDFSNLKSDSERGGWDGWISLNCTNVANGCDVYNYGVYLDPDDSKLKGHAWGGNQVVGYIDFNPTLGGVVFSGPPIVDLKVNGADSANPTWNTNVNLTWTVFGGADSCTGLGADYGWLTPTSDKSVSGSTGPGQSVGPIDNTVSFSIRCDKAGQPSSLDTIWVTPQAPFTLNASATVPPTSAGNRANLNNNRTFVSTVTVTATGFTDDVTLSVKSVKNNVGNDIAANVAFSPDNVLTSSEYGSGSAAAIVLPLNPVGAYVDVIFTGTSGAISTDSNSVRIWFAAGKAQTKVEEI